MMIRLLLFLLVLGTTPSVTAQSFAVAADKNNVLYRGVENPLSIAAPQCPCAALVVRTSVGRLTGRDCKYLFYSDTGGVAHISLYQQTKKGLRLLGVSSFRVKRIPNPTPHVGPSGGGKILAAILKAQQFIRAGDDHFDDIPTTVTQFTLTILRSDSCLYRKIHNMGNAFNAGVQAALQQILPGDTVIFSDIYAHRRSEEEMILQPLFLLVE
jgi:GldM C-terminal domain